MPGEGEDVVDNDIESDGQQASSSKRLPSLRTAIKDTPEIFETDPTSVAIEKCTKSISNQRCSNRITKRSRRDTSPVDPTSKKCVSIKPQAEPTAGSKTRRPWELWSVEDKNAFFEALCEYGKDFESIQSYIAQRSKKKGVATNMIKNKDQVRHFYYRTWHKISKYIKVTESVRKQTQELYGLVNYSELRKKIGGCLNEKNGQKLNELVFSGVTTVKLKGKKLRIKTPVCRALKKLNNVTDTKEPETEKLPKEICVEFRPHTNNAWLHVQSLAQNPRVRTKVTLQKRLSSVIEYLQKRWKPYRLKRKEQILSSLPNPLTDSKPCDNPPLLRVKPASDAKICPLTLSVMDVASSSDLCLEKYLKLSHKILCKDISKTKKPLCLNQKIQDDKQNESSEVSVTSDKLNLASEIISDCNLKELCLQTENQSTQESLSKSVCEADKLNSTDVELKDHSKSLIVTDCVSEENERATELSFSKSLEDYYKESYLMIGHDPQWNMDNLIGQSDSEVNIKHGNIVQSNQLSPKPLTDKDKNNDYTHGGNLDPCKEELVSTNGFDSIYYKTVREGWTVEESGFLTFGELYLLLGKPATIILEYEFESSDSFEDYTETSHTSTKKNVLRKVLEVAQNYFADTKNKQVLGKHRSSSKSTKVKMCNLIEKTSKEIPFILANINETEVNSKEVNNSRENDAIKTPVNISDYSLSSDKHIFAVPIAPRNVKPPDQNSLKEEIGKLLPGTRRGCRVRRKPLVVQRPLLPREGMPRPMTFVHIVPSVSSLTNVIPSNSAQSENKISIPSAKKVMQIIPSGLPIQVPIIKQVHAEPKQKLVLQQNTIPISRVSVNSSSGNPVHIINDHSITRINTGNSSATSTSSIPPVIENPQPPSHPLMSSLQLSSPPNLDLLNLDLLSESQGSLAPEDTFPTMQHMSTILDVSNSSTFSNITSTDETSFLEELGFSSKNKYDPPSGPICFSENQLSTLKQNTPPSSPLNQPFKINPPDMQWFNGESTELSLNTFLNSLESPSKLTSTSTSNLSMENSNFDPISRLAPVVDSQVRCLLDECSIDFITKFEDLADVINNSSNDSKQT